MGDECLNAMLSILSGVGLRAAADYPAGGRMEITEPVAAVGLDRLDCAAGKAVFAVRILSPGKLGGWRCQKAAASAAAAMERSGIRCEGSRMEYLSSCDCFCSLVRAELDVYTNGSQWYPGQCWKLTCNGSALVGVTEFTAEQDLDRRLVGASCQGEPVGVTPGCGGWRLKLVQVMPPKPPEESAVEEPFTLTVARLGKTEVYNGCYWNRTTAVHTQAGLRVERCGFALSREVI